MQFELQQLIKEDDDIIDVAEKIAYALAGKVRHDEVVALGHGFKGVFINTFVEFKHAAVKALERVIRIRRSIDSRAAAAKYYRDEKQAAKKEVVFIVVQKYDYYSYSAVTTKYSFNQFLRYCLAFCRQVRLHS